MADLLVHLKIPIPVEKVIGAPALTFAGWLPIGDTHAISVEEENISLKLWFDITSTWWAIQHKEELVRVTPRADATRESLKAEVREFLRSLKNSGRL